MDYYHEDFKEYFLYFDSFVELKDIISRLGKNDYDRLLRQRQMDMYAKIRQRSLEQYAQILGL